MPISKKISNQIQCCLAHDGHYVVDPVSLKCGSNACMKCVSDSNEQKVKCISCEKVHETNDLIDATINEPVQSVLFSSLDKLFEDINQKLLSINIELKGSIIVIILLKNHIL